MIHNIPMLRNLLPRAKMHPLQLDVAEEPTVASEFLGFISTVAPRLVRMSVVAEAPWFVAQTLYDHCRVFPEHRELAISWRSRTNSLVSFEQNVMPKLAHLALDSESRLSTRTCWPDLRVLECASDGPSGIASVLSGCTLRHSNFEWTYDRFGNVAETLPDAGILAALHAIPDIDVTAELHPALVRLLFDVFAPSPSPQLHLCFTNPVRYIDRPQPHPCARLCSAVYLSIFHGEKSVVIRANDGSGHSTPDLTARNPTRNRRLGADSVA